MTALLRAAGRDTDDLLGELAYAAGLLTPTLVAMAGLWAARVMGGGWG